MGGRGSGRRSSYGLLVDKVEDHQQIDLAWLRRQGCLTIGRHGRLTWSRDKEVVASVGYRVEPDGMRLIYRTRNRGDNTWTDVDELVPFTYTGANLGGRRRWFVCLGCRRRCRVIFGGSYFGCRRCHGLRYESQYEPRFSRATSQAHKLRARFGQWGSLEDPFPPKPKGMHWRTYRRLEAKDEDLQMRWTAGVYAWLQRAKPGE